MLFRRKKKPYSPKRNKQSLTIPENSDAWPAIEELFDENADRVYRFPVDDERAYQAYTALGVSKESHMGAIALHTAGILIDGGWVRILGSGADDGVPGLGAWTPVTETPNGMATRPQYMTIAVDAVGGIYAIDGGALGISIGYICYFNPEHLEWGAVAPDYASFLTWLFSSKSDELYDQWKWEGWKDSIRGLDFTDGLRLNPPLHAESFDKGSAELETEVCALTELWDTQFIAAGDKVSVPPPHIGNAQ